ncbi:hypothetical protein [Caballeronia sp. dw_19]|uniref:hypothetical protein n=1 Tax=Caballeronia sp. dw_19 TaxID=2719791 RepID=UPI001BCFC28F|nr:hypothetical protein [Caballeronia sp. dw_19]
MIRTALAVSLLTGCTVVEHVQVLPTFDKQNDAGCCVLYAELPPSTRLSVAVNKTDAGVSTKVGATWKF